MDGGDFTGGEEEEEGGRLVCRQLLSVCMCGVSMVLLLLNFAVGDF